MIEIFQERKNRKRQNFDWNGNLFRTNRIHIKNGFRRNTASELPVRLGQSIDVQQRWHPPPEPPIQTINQNCQEEETKTGRIRNKRTAMADRRRCEDPFMFEQHDCSATDLGLGLDGFLYWVSWLRSRFISGNLIKFLLSFLPQETLTRSRKTEQATNSWIVVQVYSHVSERLPLFVSFVRNGLCRRWLLVGNLSKSFLIRSRASDISSESAKFLDFTPTLNCARRCGVWNMTRRLRIGYSFTIGCTWRWVTVYWFGGRWGHSFVD